MTAQHDNHLDNVGQALADWLIEHDHHDRVDWFDSRNVDSLRNAVLAVPVPMILHCPACGLQHIDAPEPHEVDECPASGQGCSMAPEGPKGERQCRYCGSPPHWTNPPHRSHLCAGCGHIWRPADVPTAGVEAIQTKGERDRPPVAPARIIDRRSWGRALFDSAGRVRGELP